MKRPDKHDWPQDLSGAAEPIEIVFVSSDKTAEELLVYMRESHGDWLAVQHGQSWD